MLIASTVSIAAYSHLFGETAQAFSSFIALGLAFVTAPVIAVATRGKYYLARTPDVDAVPGTRQKCCICEYPFESEDMAYCPIYAGPICSLCCSLDARCHDGCKVEAQFQQQVLAFLSAFLPPTIVRHLESRLGRYFGLMVLVCGLSGLFFGLIYLQATLDPMTPRDTVASTLWNVYFVFVVIAGVTCWLFVLATESRRVAQEESNQQSSLLTREIRAHQRTDEQLQKAKEAAEAANEAKSRYMAGISHELRTPLNTILGYAQILEHDPALPPHREDSVRVIRRSAEHLAGLIEGLLDISKIEAGRLNIYRDEFRFADFLDQLVEMFRIQAENKGIRFAFTRPRHLPEFVHTDERRLRQILINLLSNAIKFTDEGHVTLDVAYRGQVAVFTVEDSGSGIAETDLERIFRPFERIHRKSQTIRPGTGLGLTITKLLTEVLGGELTVESTIGQGSRFQVRLMLSAVRLPMPKRQEMRRIYGYKGRRLTVIAADDDPDHREMINEILSPLGFILFSAEDGPSCLELAAQCEPDIFLLDISLPGMSGWEIAGRLRRSGFENTPIIMVSAVVGGDAPSDIGGDLGAHLHDAMVAKPIRIDDLLSRMGNLLKIEWIHDLSMPAVAVDPREVMAQGESLPLEDLRELRALSQTGQIRAVQDKLSDLEARYPDLDAFTSELRAIVGQFDFDRLDAILGDLHREHAE